METQGTLYALRGLLIGFSIAVFFMESSLAHSIIQPWQNRMGSNGQFSLVPKISFYNSSENYDVKSESVLIPQAYQVNRTYYDLLGTYGLSETITLFARLSILSTRVDTGGLRDNSHFGFSDQLIGASYQLIQKPEGLKISLQGEITIPAYQNKVAKQANNAYLGDGSFDFTLGGFSELPIMTNSLGNLQIEGGAGFTYRSYGFSSAIPWSLFLKQSPPISGFLLGLGARGNLTLNTDVSDPAIAITDQTMGAGGSYLINALNPSWGLAQIEAGYQVNPNTQFLMSTSLPIGGTNAPKGFLISFSAKITWGSPPQKLTLHKKSNLHSTSKTYDLETNVIGINDQLFLVKINQGQNAGITQGQIFDIFKDSEMLAKAKVTHVRDEESALYVLEYYQEKSIDTDAVAKRLNERE